MKFLGIPAHAEVMIHGNWKMATCYGEDLFEEKKLKKHCKHDVYESFIQISPELLWKIIRTRFEATIGFI